MTVEQFLEDGRQLYKALETVAPYPVHSYAAAIRAMLPKALKALEVSYKEIRKIEGPQQSFSHGSATSVLAEMRAALEDA